MNGIDQVRKVALGAGGAATAQREFLARWLETAGYRVVIIGPAASTAAGRGAADGEDWADAVLGVCRKVAGGDCERGIVLEATGIGASIAANKLPGIRAALCWDERTAIDAREHENANVLALGTAMHGVDGLCAISRAWLEARFDAPRHAARANRIAAIERGGFDT